MRVIADLKEKVLKKKYFKNLRVKKSMKHFIH